MRSSETLTLDRQAASRGEVPTCRNPAAGVEKLEAPQILALAFRMVSLAAPEPPERKPKRTFSRR
jgi:hypothetical protein